MFYHFSPNPNTTGRLKSAAAVEVLNVPVLNLEHGVTKYVELGTVIVVVLGAILIAWSLWGVLIKDFRVRFQHTADPAGDKERKKTE